VPRRLTKLRIFVASPGDVSAERERLDGIVDELNATLGTRTNIVLELVRWETHAWPGFGEDAQEVINGQIEPYDIFVGIMWKRLGTPTHRGASGTVEEFERAFDRWVEHRTPAIMFYFNRASFYPSSAEDVQQFERVLEFKEIVVSKGAFFWEYEGVEDFERHVRPHLYRQIESSFGGPSSSAGEPRSEVRTAARLPKAGTSAYFEMMRFLLADSALDAEIRDESDEAFAALAADRNAKFHRFMTRHWEELDEEERDLFVRMPEEWESLRQRWNAMPRNERSELRAEYIDILASTNRAFLDARSPEEKAADDRLFDAMMKASQDRHEAMMNLFRSTPST
jgi:Domain of unknown function (DUF4062)